MRDFKGRAWWQWPTAVLLGLVLALQQALAADVTPPKLESWKQWPDEINVTDGFRRVYVEFRVTDDESGIKTPSITANSSSTSQSSGFGGISVIESSENGLDITFRGEVQIPQGSAPGAWSITLFPLEDEQGNSGSFGPMGFNSGFTVIENSAPAASTLSMNLEEPVAGLVHMGVGNLRGWAVSSAGVRSVKAYLDGELLAEIPYGGTRGDVASAFPDIEGSVLSGFSMSLNYSGLTAGSHTLEVITESVDNKTVSQTAEFLTVRFDREFIGADEIIDLNAAASVLSGEEMRVENISIAGKSYNLLLRWRTAEQGFEIVELVPLD